MDIESPIPIHVPNAKILRHIAKFAPYCQNLHYSAHNLEVSLAI
jgi:hypothetical protein